jgi:hypothetical protein
MGFLAPLYIAGFLAIGLPILFHLMRRSPRGKQIFSSLMFLQQSPPRLTKRSRLDNILLLILRATAFILLAFAFARPFLQFGSNLDTYQSTGNRVALLIDTSASMQRGDLWQQAKRQVDAALTNVKPTDEVALFAFDSTLRPVFSFDEWNGTAVGERMAALKARLETLSPTWAPTRLGDALASAADLAAESVPGTNGKPVSEKLRREVVLVTDRQQGSRAEALQGHQWPPNVYLSIPEVGLKGVSNASLQWVNQTEMAEATGSEPSSTARLRVRLANDADATKEQFTITWGNTQGPLKNQQAVMAYCPAGHNQIVRIPWPSDGQVPDRLLLKGDDAEYDNTLYLVPPRSESVKVVYYGEDGANDVRGAQFYMRSALGDTPQRHMEFVNRGSGLLSDTDLLEARLLVITTPPPAESYARLRRFAEQGGGILWMLANAESGQAAVQFLNKPETPIPVTEAVPDRSGNFALISRVETRHPLFAPFADARFGDFTKIHFWKHRKMRLPNPLPSDLQVLAWFDNSDPFLMEHPGGKGWVRIATSTWTPADSQLALSTKFVPLLEGLIARQDLMAGGSQYVLGEPISLVMSNVPPPLSPPPSTAGATQPGLGTAQSTQPATRGEAIAGTPGRRAVVAPDGRRIEVLTSATTFEGADRPGIYRLITGNGGEEIALAVNLPSEESRTTPLPVEDFERWGAKLVQSGTRGAEGAEETATRERRLHLAELENRQKMWRWLILGVLLLLAAETALAGRLAHRAPAPEKSS